MSDDDEWSPDEPLEAESFRSWDEALDEEDELEPGALGLPEGERALDRELIVDEAALEEIGAELDDPDQLAVLDGGIDDPDGAYRSPGRPAGADAGGWDLDAETGPDDDE